MKTHFIMPKLFIETFEKIVLEYFEKVSTLHLLDKHHTKLHSANIIFIGLNTIMHIFRITICKYKNTEITYHYCKQGFFYYLEYIQQISNVDFQNNLNINDAIIFVYSKTLVPLTELTEPIHPTIAASDTHLLHNLATITNGILLWKIEMPIHLRSEIATKYLSKYLNLFEEPNNEKYVKFLDKIERTQYQIEPIQLYHYLDHFYKNIKRLCKSNTILTDEEIQCKLELRS